MARKNCDFALNAVIHKIEQTYAGDPKKKKIAIEHATARFNHGDQYHAAMDEMRNASPTLNETESMHFQAMLAKLKKAEGAATIEQVLGREDAYKFKSYLARDQASKGASGSKPKRFNKARMGLMENVDRWIDTYEKSGRSESAAFARRIKRRLEGMHNRNVNTNK